MRGMKNSENQRVTETCRRWFSLPQFGHRAGTTGPRSFGRPPPNPKMITTGSLARRDEPGRPAPDRPQPAGRSRTTGMTRSVFSSYSANPG